MDAIWVAPTATLLIGYLLGSIPFGLVLSWMGGAGDIRKIGSGSIGATNVLRTGRKGLAALTVLLDGGKGVLAVIAAQAIDPSYGAIAGLAAFVGHCYPIWLRFKGGKGVATAFGVLLALSWPIAVVCAVVWLGMLALLRYSSVGGMTAAIVAPVAAAVRGEFDLTMLLIAMALIVLWKHRANIERLMAGTEPRVGQTS